MPLDFFDVLIVLIVINVIKSTHQINTSSSSSNFNCDSYILAHKIKK